MGVLVEFSTVIADDICDSSDSDALHLSITHDEISRQIANCNNGYKFVAYSHNILQEFVVDNEVVVMIHFQRFPVETVRKLHARRTRSYRVLRRITSITHELNIPRDPSNSLIFNGKDSTLSDACALLELSLTTTDPSHRTISLSPPWVRVIYECQFIDHHHGLIKILHARRLFNSTGTCLTFVIDAFTRDECFQTGHNDGNRSRYLLF